MTCLGLAIKNLHPPEHTYWKPWLRTAAGWQRLRRSTNAGALISSKSGCKLQYLKQRSGLKKTAARTSLSKSWKGEAFTHTMTDVRTPSCQLRNRGTPDLQLVISRLGAQGSVPHSKPKFNLARKELSIRGSYYGCVTIRHLK